MINFSWVLILISIILGGLVLYLGVKGIVTKRVWYFKYLVNTLVSFVFLAWIFAFALMGARFFEVFVQLVSGGSKLEFGLWALFFVSTIVGIVFLVMYFLTTRVQLWKYTEEEKQFMEYEESKEALLKPLSFLKKKK